MTKNQVADILDEIGTLLELRGENPFKCRAFHNASKVIAGLTTELSTLVESDKLFDLPGIGKGVGDKIIELLQTGKMAYYDELKQSIPPGLIAMMQIQGLGPKRIKILHDKLRIATIEELRSAAEAHTLAAFEGFGKKTEENILKGIEQLSRHVDKHLYFRAIEAAERICTALTDLPEVLKCDIAGSLRRRKEIIGDIDILAAAKAKHTGIIMDAFTTHVDVERIVGRGETKSSILLHSGIPCDLRVIETSEYPFALSYFTGSKEHNVAMRSRAKEFGWSLNEYGFSKLSSKETRGAAKRIVPCRNEEDIYAALQLQYVPPELRENLGEFEAAETKTIPALVEVRDLRGTFHCHTTYSDGRNTIPEMADAAQRLGWEYLGIADHSKVAAYAGGLTLRKLRVQFAEIDRLNDLYSPFHIFKGTEVDILADGTLDWSDDILSQFDYVVASVHSKFRMTELEMTRRIISAIKNKYVTMLGHPTGRLLLQRDSYPVDMVQVIQAASDYGTAIEINSNPLRLELDWRLCKYARDKGVKICINPDAHSSASLEDVRFGVGVARKGWLRAEDIINTRKLRDVKKLLN